MINRIFRIACISFLIILSGCSSLQSLDTDWINQILYTPTPPPARTATSTPAPTESTQSATEELTPAVAEPQILRIWLPPQFNPNVNNPSAALLKQRLSDFEADHPGLELDVRIKSETGDADLLDSLSITSMAAPGAMPDLIALPRYDLEAAAQKGLVQPLNEISGELESPDWFSYARDLANIEGTPYGLPFAGDALVISYRPELVWIKSWDDILLSESQLVFSGADPLSELALSLYASAGGELTDVQGNPTLDQEVLTEVLELISRGRAATLFPEAVKNISSDEQVLQEYRANRAEMAISHFSRYRPSQDGLVQPLMSLGDEPHFTFANGWMWALTNANPAYRQISLELAEYLVEEDFLDPWTEETGYLPTRRFPINGDSDAAFTAIVEAAQLAPSTDTLQVLGPLMQGALLRVLNGEEPETVARSVVDELR